MPSMYIYMKAFEFFGRALEVLILVMERFRSDAKYGGAILRCGLKQKNTPTKIDSSRLRHGV